MFTKLATAAAAAVVLIGPGVAQAGSTQNLSQRALGALGARWTAEARSYQAPETTDGYNARALRALGERYQARVDTGSSYTPGQLRALDDRWHALAAGYKPIADLPTAGFDWQDGGIGAAAGFALALALAGGLRLRGHRRTAIPA
jgi:hypothetical protein